MKRKYMFYLFMMILIHYEVGRIVSTTTTAEANDEQPSSQKGVKLDESERFIKPLGYEHEVRFISINNNNYHKHAKLWKTAYKGS